MRTNSCPTCEGFKDRRAIQCKACQFRDRHPRLGRGQVRYENKNGYITIRVNRKAYYEHRYVMEQRLGRKLRRDEHVHHINGDKTDNRPENLELMTASAHHRQHMIESWKAKRMSKLGIAARWGKRAAV